jgi:hypothetical protein
MSGFYDDCKKFEVRTSRGYVTKISHGGPVLRGIASAMHLRMRKNGGGVLVLALSQHAVDVEMYWVRLKASSQNAAICAEIWG